MAKSASEAGAIAPEILAKYEPVIGLEVHVQLLTATKIFCGCANRFGDAPNSNVCPVCLGLPGSLPVLNRRAVEMATLASLAIHCTVHEHSRFARKNYFYPDLPKGYQISQYELPLATGGWIEIELEGVRKRIGVTRLHLEEDAAKNLHEGFAESSTKAYIDYNRCGTPLSEIVSEPDMRTPEEAYAYLTTLRQMLLYTGVSDCNMEEGSLRCDANVSVRLRGCEERSGTKVEVKNLNSFRYLQKALEFEIERHIGVLEGGGKIVQETRLWNEAARPDGFDAFEGKAHDYRYFPGPDLLPVHVSAEWQRKVREAHAGDAGGEAGAIRAGFRDYGLRCGGVGGDALRWRIISRRWCARGLRASAAANWISTELLGRLNDSGKEIAESPVRPESLAGLIAKVEAGEITGATGKKVFAPDV